MTGWIVGGVVTKIREDGEAESLSGRRPTLTLIASQP